MFAGILRQLTPGGIVLTVTRPQEVDYPLFEAARQVGRWQHQFLQHLEELWGS